MFFYDVWCCETLPYQKLTLTYPSIKKQLDLRPKDKQAKRRSSKVEKL
jgi:hypothetical protein